MPDVSLPSSEPPGAKEGPEPLPPKRARGNAQEIEGVEGGAAVSMEGTPGGQPVLVEFEDEDGPPRPARLVTKGQGKTLAPQTTEQEDIVTEGQRRVNFIWEGVQGIISISITLAVVYCQLNDISSETLNNAFFFVIATYLHRTNGTRIGGIGRKANELGSVYRGR